MHTEKLSLEHRDIIRQKLSSLATPVSEYSFANLYLFRDAHGYQVITDNDLIVTGKTRDGVSYAMPLFDLRRADFSYVENVLDRFGVLFPVPEDWTGIFSPGKFHVSTTEDDWDYAYSIERLASLGGKKLHKKRNLLNQFNESYRGESYPLTRERVADARAVLDRWIVDMDLTHDDADYRACAEALDLFDELGLCGAMYYADARPAGFIIGEGLNEKVYALHFAKGLRDVKGIYQFMYNDFARIMPSRFYSLNFEQDLGDPGLRQAKSSYYPDYMIKKYRVSRA